MSTYTDITEDYSGFEDLSNERLSSIPLASQNHLSIYRILGICCVLIAFQVPYSIELSIITPMMTDYNIPHVFICVIWMTVSIVSFFMHPLIMYFSNSITSNFGRRRPFILGGGFFILLSFISLFLISGFAFKIDEKTKLVQYLITSAFLTTFLILHLSIKMVQVPSQLLFTEIIPEKDQNYTRSIGSIVSSFSATFTYLIGGLNFSQYINKKYGNSSFQMFTNDQLFLMICFFVVLISLIISLISSNEENASNLILKAVTNPFKEIQQVLSSRPKSIIWISIIYLFSWMAYYPFTVFITNYFGRTIQSSKSSTMNISDEGKSFGMFILALSQIIELMTSFVTPRIIAKINMKKTYVISMSILTVMLLISGFVENKFALMCIYSLIGLSPSIFKTIPHLLIQIVVPSEQLNIHRNILNSAASIGKVASMLLLGICVGFIKPNDRYIIAGGSLFAVVSAILCHWMILPYKPIDFEQDFAQPHQGQTKVFN